MTKPWHKYWVLLKMYFAVALTKRADFFGYAMHNAVTMLSILLVWMFIYDPQKAINGYSLTDTVFYYIFLLLIIFATTGDTLDFLARQIKEGSFSEWLIKPRRILWTELARSWGEQLNRLLILTPLYLVILIAIFLTNSQLNFSVFGFVGCFLFILLGFFLNTLLEFTIAMIAFWLDEVWSLKHFKLAVADTLGGKRFPISFLPLGVQQVLKFLPFQFLYYLPLEYLLGKRTDLTALGEDLLIWGVWMVMLYLLQSVLYAKGVKRYAAFGN